MKIVDQSFLLVLFIMLCKISRGFWISVGENSLFVQMKFMQRSFLR